MMFKMVLKFVTLVTTYDHRLLRNVRASARRIKLAAGNNNHKKPLLLCFSGEAKPIAKHNEVMICMEAMATCLDLLLKRTGHEPIPEPIVGKMSVSVVRALDYLKENHNVIHRDVKPSNILLDWNGVVKLCDFGISGFLIESRAKSKLAGCPPYMAPERVRSTENTPYDIRSDVWSLGITLVELATGRFPYEGSDFQIITSILELPSPSLKVSAKIIAFKALNVSQTLQFSNLMRYHLTLMLRLTSYHTLRLYSDIWRINVDARADDLKYLLEAFLLQLEQPLQVD
ncbi:hypothetical protein TELCIR_10995 [Teladorsagia circumcincta]|uniref:mitogen-activated protein kinase kinase n=1 Tax=Teladorsagia circumcincta TaxID=45464 RepID=A0A2G9UAL3_TELCI|nr:hypothetical protein TELCIR_10995 [Teladorsagia circumcincta]